MNVRHHLVTWITCVIVNLDVSAYGINLPEWKKRAQPQSLADLHFVHSVAIVQGFLEDGTPQPLRLSKIRKNNDRFLVYLSDSDLMASHAINTPRLSKGKVRLGKNAAMKRFMDNADVSALIIADKVSWMLRVDAEDQTAAPPKDLDVASLDTWMYDLMGYEGVIIDQVGNQLLVLGDPKLFQRKKLQGLVVDKSDAKYFLEKSDKKGLAIIQMVEAQGQYATFEIVVAENANKNIQIARGTKVILERVQKQPER